MRYGHGPYQIKEHGPFSHPGKTKATYTCNGKERFGQSCMVAPYFHKGIDKEVPVLR